MYTLPKFQFLQFLKGGQFGLVAGWAVASVCVMMVRKAEVTNGMQVA
jgi:hypothetical protein